MKNNSACSLTNFKDKYNDSVPFRIEFIKGLLEGKTLEPIVDFQNLETENFIPNNQYDGDSDSKSRDTRYILNKKLLKNKLFIMKGYNIIKT